MKNLELIIILYMKTLCFFLFSGSLGFWVFLMVQCAFFLLVVRDLGASLDQLLEILKPVHQMRFLGFESEEVVPSSNPRVKAVTRRRLVLGLAPTECEVILRRIAMLAWLSHA